MNDINPIIVIIATFNRKNRLLNAVQSITEQTSSNWLLVIVDDGSEDGTKEYLESLSDPRISTHSFKKNAGVNKARNKAIDIIQEKNLSGYITLLDDDDRFKTQCFEEFTNIIKETVSSNWFTANCIRVDGSKISKIKSYGPASYIFDYMYGKRIRGDLSHFINTDIIGDIRFTTRFKNSEEWFFFSQIAQKNDLFTINYDAKIVETLPTGLLLSKVNKDKKIEVLKYKLETFRDFLPEKYTSLQTISLSNELAKSGQKEEARRLLNNMSLKNKIRYKYFLAYLRCK
ncbi:MAG: glycosyltransferase family 2 protein [Oleispira sp.]|nr:glycosyltransferase family 2 protein [Oleispira sp.]MBL4882540.1 glycosyltransferase family 2 protein [Oleispira sp.]